MTEGPVLRQRKTRQRDAILDVIRTAAGPLTVSEILERGQESVSGLGIATVYRTAKLLLEAGDIRKVVLQSGENRYELAELGHHHHFHCRICDTVFDFDVCPLRLPRNEPFAGGYIVEDHEVTLYGTCPACHA